MNDTDPDLIRDTKAALDRFQQLIKSIENAFENNISHSNLNEMAKADLTKHSRDKIRFSRDSILDASLSDQQSRYFDLFWSISDLVELAIDAALKHGIETSSKQSGSEGGRRSAPTRIAAANIWREPTLEFAISKRAEKPSLSTSALAKLVEKQLAPKVDVDTVRSFLYKMEQEGRLEKTRASNKARI